MRRVHPGSRWAGESGRWMLLDADTGAIRDLGLYDLDEVLQAVRRVSED